MLHKKSLLIWKTVKATIIDIIVAFIAIIVIVFIVNALFGKQIKSAISYADMISIGGKQKVLEELKYNEETKKLQEYPEYGTRYGDIKIESLDVNLPLYYGDKLEYLKYGVGQSSSGYFPGEGGSIICMGHNTKTFLYNLPNIKNGSSIQIITNYGEFEYKVYETKVINMYNLEEMPIQNEEEILMLYTCYPVNTLGQKNDRFVVYAKRINN